tara:strand:+ start:189 stop:401 length:213 start_codon:yes stop_codon:yes gene_type:complete
MNLIINGESLNIQLEEHAITIENLISQLKYHPQLIVIEYNGNILDPKEWKEQQVKEGDRLEIVTIVGGGS